jgi:parallel beta-helix repeat protein
LKIKKSSFVIFISILLLLGTTTWFLESNFQFIGENFVVRQLDPLRDSRKSKLDRIDNNFRSIYRPAPLVSLDNRQIRLEPSFRKPGLKITSASYNQWVLGSISITSNADFGVSGYDFPGYGNATHPWLIEGWNITETSGPLISISGTTDQFVIRNNLVDASTLAWAISLSNVVNGTIENNIIANSSSDAIYIYTSSYIIIANNTMYNNNHKGIRLETQVNNTIIRNNTIFNCGESGIHLDNSHYNQILNNTIFGPSYGIDLFESQQNNISKNIVRNNNQDGIWLHTSSHNTLISHNIVYENRQGIRLQEINHNCTILNNTVYTNNEDNIWVEDSHNLFISNNTVFGGTSGNGIRIYPQILSKIVNLTLKFNIIHNSYWFGVDLDSVNNGTIIGNNIYNNSEHGMELAGSEGSKNVKIENNTIRDNGWTGLTFQSSFNITILNNTITGNGGGIDLGGSGGSNNFTIAENTISGNNGNGLKLDGSDNCTIVNNLISGNNGLGINMLDPHDSIITDNTVSSNGGGIWISGSHNVLSENRIHGNSYAGIELNTAIYIKVRNNTIYSNTDHGIKIQSSSTKNKIIENRIYENNWVGISLDSSPNNELINNTIHSINGGNGIDTAVSSVNTTISGNTIYNCDNGGITIGGDSGTSNIHNNMVYMTILTRNRWGINLGGSTGNNVSYNTVYHTEFAIDLADSSNNNITDNIVHDNINGIITSGQAKDNRISRNFFYKNEAGISLSSDSHEISFNLFYDNNEQGIRIENDANDNRIFGNDFTNNHPQASDKGSNNSFEGNYWSDWSGIGTYKIDGEAGNEDSSPLLNAHHMTAPEILAPTNETSNVLKDNVTIQWIAVSDQYDHSITYSVYYSTDGGSSWTEISSGLINTDYTWDLSTIYDGTEVLLKVQAIDNLGFRASFISQSVFTIENPSLTKTTTTPTTTPTTTLITTEDSSSTTETEITPGLTSVILLISICVLIVLRKKDLNE